MKEREKLELANSIDSFIDQMRTLFVSARKEDSDETARNYLKLLKNINPRGFENIISNHPLFSNLAMNDPTKLLKELHLPDRAVIEGLLKIHVERYNKLPDQLV